jgi:hypothetical protein
LLLCGTVCLLRAPTFHEDLNLRWEQFQTDKKTVSDWSKARCVLMVGNIDALRNNTWVPNGVQMQASPAQDAAAPVPHMHPLHLHRCSLNLHASSSLRLCRQHVSLALTHMTASEALMQAPAAQEAVSSATHVHPLTSTSLPSGTVERKALSFFCRQAKCLQAWHRPPTAFSHTMS